MGINNTTNSLNVELTSTSKQVVPNRSVTMPAYTDVGWTAGDYLYQSINGVVGAPTGSTTIGGPITTLQATNVTVTGGLFNSTQTLLNPNKTGATYTGASTTPGSTIFFQEVSSTTSATAGRCVSLTNGSIVMAFYDVNATTKGYYFIIYDVAGNITTAKTLIQTETSASYRNIIPVAYADGSFGVGFSYPTGGNLLVSKKYTAAGTLISTSQVGCSNPPGTNLCMRAIQLTNGNIVYAYRSDNNGYGGFAVFNNANSNLGSGQFNTSYFALPSYPSASFGLYQIPGTIAGSYTNCWGVVGYSSNQGSGCYVTYTSSGSSLSAGNTSGNYIYYSQDLVQLQDGTYLWVGSNSGASLNATKCTFEASTGSPLGSGSTANYANNFNYPYEVRICPYLNSGFFVAYYDQGSTTTVQYVKSTGITSAVSSVTSVATLTSGGYYTAGLGMTCGTNGAIYYSTSAGNSTTYLGALSSQTITNGTTYTATSLTPPNYTFLGIAENTTAAATVGNIIVGGNAIANSNMPNVSGTVYFDSTQYTTFGNKGYVTGRNLTLKGFE